MLIKLEKKIIVGKIIQKATFLKDGVTAPIKVFEVLSSLPGFTMETSCASIVPKTKVAPCSEKEIKRALQWN